MAKEHYGILVILGIVVVIAVLFMYYSGGPVGEATRSKVTESFVCIFENSEIPETCGLEGPGLTCTKVGRCEIPWRDYKASRTLVSSSTCGGPKYPAALGDGNRKEFRFNCAKPTKPKEYGVGDKFRITPNKAQDVLFKDARKPVKLLFKSPDSVFFVGEYSPGYVWGSYVVHIPVDNVLVVIRMVGGGPDYVEFQVESIGKPSKRYAWPSLLGNPAAFVNITKCRPWPDAVKIPTGSIVALDSDSLCFVWGMFDTEGYEIRAVNPGETAKFIARTNESKFKVFEWKEYDKGEILTVTGLPAAANNNANSS